MKDNIGHMILLWGKKIKIQTFDHQMNASSHFRLEQTKRLYSTFSVCRKFRKINQWVTKPINFKELISYDHAHEKNTFKLEIKKVSTKINIT